MMQDSNSFPKILLGVVALVMIAAIGYGFVQTGGPFHQRKVRMDEERVRRLSGIQRALQAHYRDEEQLPSDLESLLEDGDRHYGSVDREDLSDPETGKAFEYRVVDTDEYTLCAVFATEHTDEDHRVYRIYRKKDWFHPEGRYCFERVAKRKERD